MENIWKIFAESINGKYIIREYWHSAKTEISHKGYQIIFDNYTEYKTVSNSTYEQSYTRVISNLPLTGFEFEIYPKNIFSSIAKVFGMQDIEISEPEFDKIFIIKSNNEFKIKQLLNNKKIRTLLKDIPKANLLTSHQKGIWEEQLPQNEIELSFFTEGEISDLAVLTKILDLFTLLIDQLLEINVIPNKQI